MLGALFVLLSVAHSYLESQQLFEKEKMEGEKKPPMCVFYARTSKQTLFFDQIVPFKFVRRPPGAPH